MLNSRLKRTTRLADRAAMDEQGGGQRVLRNAGRACALRLRAYGLWGMPPGN